MKIIIDSFFNKMTKALNNKLPFAAFRHPKSKELIGYFQKEDNLFLVKNYSESGFVFAPFDDKKPSILFPLEESEVYTTTCIDINDTDNRRKSDILSIYQDKKSKHIGLVKRGIEFLKATGVKKVVLSRKEVLELSYFDVLETFKKLLVTDTDATVYVWFHPKVGLWLGATPESLLKIEGLKFQTMALAGTQLYQGNLDVNWQQKDIKEQQYVTDYIIDQISKVTETSVASKTNTVKAGNLVHICTSINGEVSQELQHYELIKLLHPTPAICGLPKKAAKAFILENEEFEREFYTGFLGELNINGKSNLFVNLRCMQVSDNQISIYVGGGITVDSVPLKEWEETVDKSKVMMRTIK